MESGMSKKSRIEYLDIAKGMGIILVVCGHAYMPYYSYITHFHMPLFFLISGFLYSSKASVKDFFLRKVKSLYIPFVFWNVVAYLVRQNIDLEFNAFLSFLEKLLLTWTKEWMFMGPTWFLGALFTELMLYKIIDKMMPVFKCKRLCILLLYILRAAYAFSITLPYRLSRTFILGMFLVMGHWLKENVDLLKKYDKHLTAWMAGIIFVLVGHFERASMSNNEYSSAFWFVIGALAGSYFLVYVARCMVSCNKKIIVKIKGILCYFSVRSMDIMIWHKIWFALVVLLQMFLYHKPLEKWMKYYPVFKEKDGWWLLYVLVGIGVSLLWTKFLRMGPWGKWLKKMHVL